MQKRKITFQAASAAVMAAVMLMASNIPVMAAGTNYGEVISGTKTTTFDKYLVMDKQANVPNASFTYAVAAGQAKSYDVDGKRFEVLAGVDADKVTITGTSAGTIAYENGDATLQDENSLVKDYDNTTEKYAKKTAMLDFSACDFTEPGIYRYVITESGTNQGITNDADLTRIMDVYVNDASDTTEKKLEIAGYVLHSNADDAPDITMGDSNGSSGEYTATKSQGFTNVYDTSDLTFRKEVSGNQASHDKYFEFTVEITDAVAGTVYDVDITGADAASGSNAATIEANTGKTNPTTLTVGADGTVTQKFYMQHGQEITILGIAKDTNYDVTENAEDYKSTAAGVENYKDNVEGTIVSTDLKTSYLNTRNGVIPTGIAVAVGPFAVIALLGGFGAASIAIKRRRDTEV